MRAADVPVASHPEVYEPAEDSWLLADAVLALPPAPRLVLEVGPGAGLASACAALGGARVVAVDVNPHACAATRATAALNGVRVDVARGDLAACHGGEGGVEVARRLVRDLPRLLAPGGEAWLVASSRGDLEALRAEAARAGLAVEEAGEARFFFERVVLWRLRRAAA